MDGMDEDGYGRIFVSWVRKKKDKSLNPPVQSTRRRRQMPQHIASLLEVSLEATRIDP